MKCVDGGGKTTHTRTYMSSTSVHVSKEQLSRVDHSVFTLSRVFGTSEHAGRVRAALPGSVTSLCVAHKHTHTHKHAHSRRTQRTLLWLVCVLPLAVRVRGERSVTNHRYTPTVSKPPPLPPTTLLSTCAIAGFTPHLHPISMPTHLHSNSQLSRARGLTIL